jgi:WD40 repeat protein
MALAVVSRSLDDGEIRQILITALKSMRESHQLTEISKIAVQFSSEELSEQLFTLIKQADFLPLEPQKLRVAVALACGWPERLNNDGPEVVPELLAAWQAGSISAAAETALLSLREVSSLDALCEEWFNKWTENHKLLEIIKRINHLPRRDPKLRVAVALACGWPERLANDGPGILAPLLEAWSRQTANPTATGALGLLRCQPTIDLLCRHWIYARLTWSDTTELRLRLGDFLEPSEPTDLSWFFLSSEPPERPPDEKRANLRSLSKDWEEIWRPWVQAEARWQGLGELLQGAGHAPSEPVERVLFWMMSGHPEGLADDGPGILPPLLAIWSWETTKPLVRQAFLKLRAAATIHALCQHWIETGDTGDELAELLLEAKHTPSDRAEKALFWLLIGQAGRYEQLDPDGSLLAQTQATASARVRQRLAMASAATGRTEWLRVMRQNKTLEAFTADDWATTILTLIRSGDAVEIWRWALLAPPVHSRTLLQALPSGADPPPSLGEGARELWALAQHQLPPPAEDKGWLEDHGTRTLEDRTSNVQVIAWSPDGRFLAAGRSDQTIQLWDPASGACVHTLNGYRHVGHQSRTTSTGSFGELLAWSPDGRHIAACCKQTIRVWEAASGICLHTLQEPAQINVSSIAWSPDGSCLASIGNGGICLWDGISGACTLLHGCSCPGGSLAWSSDGQTIAASCGTLLFLVDVRSRETTHLNDYPNGVRALAWQPRGRVLASASNHSVRLWDMASQSHLPTLEGHTALITGLTWSPDGRWLASCGQDQTIRLWNPVSFTCHHILQGHARWVHSLTWSADGRWLASTSHDQTIRLWNPANGTCAYLLRSQGRSVWSLAWSPDGGCLASAGGQTIWLWRRDRHDLAEILTTPLASFDHHAWTLLGEFTRTSLAAEDWAAPWVTFIRGLGTLIRRFDVSVEDVVAHQGASPFEVEIEG